MPSRSALCYADRIVLFYHCVLVRRTHASTSLRVSSPRHAARTPRRARRPRSCAPSSTRCVSTSRTSVRAFNHFYSIEFDEMRAEANIAKTAKLPSVLPAFEGMEMILDETVLPPKFVRGSPCTP